MRDPHPENIGGSKVQKHVFEHSMNWGHIALAVAVLVVVWKVAPVLASDDEEKDQDLAFGTEV
jgi:hypothetical protein